VITHDIPLHFSTSYKQDIVGLVHQRRDVRGHGAPYQALFAAGHRSLADPAEVVARRSRFVRDHLIPDTLDKYGTIRILSWLTMGSVDDARADPGGDDEALDSSSGRVCCSCQVFWSGTRAVFSACKERPT
jgi:hypothetical protein